MGEVDDAGGGDVSPFPQVEKPVGYHQDFEWHSRGMMVDFVWSRGLFRDRYVTRTKRGIEENDNLRIGKGTHAIALRDGLELQNMRKIPKSALTSNGRKVGNRWTKFCKLDENQGKTLLLEKQYQLCEDLSAALHEKIGRLIDDPRSKREWEHRWNGILPYRMKADLVAPELDGMICIDLKTARDIHPLGFRHEVKSRLLWLQAAHYTMGVEDEFQLPCRFIFACVRKQEPHLVKLYEVPESTLAIARRQHRKISLEILRCREENDWREPNDDMIEEVFLAEKDMRLNF